MENDLISMHTKLDKNARKNLLTWFAKSADSVQAKILKEVRPPKIENLDFGERSLVGLILSAKKNRDMILLAGKRKAPATEEIEQFRKDQIKAHLRNKNKNKSLKISRLLRLSEEIVRMREQEGMRWKEIQMYLDKYRSLKVTIAYLCMNYEALKKSVELKASQKPSD
jgi:hypothetical protein